MFSPSVSEPVHQGTLEVAAPRAGALTTQPGGDEAEDGVGGPGFQMGGSPPEPHPVCQVCVSQTPPGGGLTGKGWAWAQEKTHRDEER